MYKYIYIYVYICIYIYCKVASRVFISLKTEMKK